MRTAAIISLLISTILQLQAEPTPEKNKEYVFQPPLLDDDTCIKMTDAKESEINQIVKELTEFIDSLAEKHEFFDLRLVKLDIDKYSEAEDDDSTTVLELFVNDCAKNVDVDNKGADNGNYDAIKSLDDASTGDKSLDGKNIASLSQDTIKTSQNDLTSETDTIDSKTNIKSLQKSKDDVKGVIKTNKNKFVSNVNKINITRRTRRKDKSKQNTNIDSNSKNIESKTNYEEKIAAVNSESEKILESITEAIQKYENDSKKMSANNLNVNSINSEATKTTENINSATNEQSTTIKNVEEKTTVYKSDIDNKQSKIVQNLSNMQESITNVEENTVSKDQVNNVRNDSTGNVKSTTSNISENALKISSKESDKLSSINNNVKQSTNNIKNINKINENSSSKFFREHDIRSSANDINIDKTSHKIVRSMNDSDIVSSDNKNIGNNVSSSINNVENQSQSAKNLVENVSHSRTSHVSSINNVKDTSQSNIIQNENTLLNKSKQLSAKISNNRYQSQDNIENINYDKNSFSEQKISENSNIDPNNFRRSDNDDYIDDGSKDGVNSVNDEKFYDTSDNDELTTDDNSSTVAQSKTTYDKNSATANTSRKYNKNNNQITNQSVGSRSIFDINENRLVNSLKNIIRKEIASVYNEVNSNSNDKYKAVDCGSKNVDEDSLWDDDFIIKYKPQIVFLDLEDKALDLLNMVKKNKCKKSPWLMYLQVDNGQQQVMFL